MRVSRVLGRSALVTAGALLVVAGCSGGSGGSEDAADVDPTRVAVVADSEVPTEVADLLGARDDIEVISASSTDGATMSELDPAVAEALAAEPEVLVWSGGTNDLGAGATEMLAGVRERLARYAEQTCVVFAVPIFRYERGSAAQVEAETAGTRLLEGAAVDSGAVVASYLDVSLAMDEQGRDFFGAGELGDIHPGPQAYPDVADEIAAAVGRCEASG